VNKAIFEFAYSFSENASRAKNISIVEIIISKTLLTELN